jgi:hypothetical protein
MADKPWPRLYSHPYLPEHYVARGTDGGVYIFVKRAGGWWGRATYAGARKGWLRFPPERGKRVMVWVASPPGVGETVSIAVDPPDGD